MAGTKRRNHRRRRASALVVLGALTVGTLCTPGQAAGGTAGRIERIDLKGNGTATTVVVTLSQPIAFDVKVLDGDAAKKSTRRIVLDFPDATLAPDAAKPIDVGNDLLRQIRPGQFNAKTARIVLDLASDAKHSIDAFESPPHVTIALGNPATAGMPTADEARLETPPSSAGATTAGAPAAQATAGAPSVAASGAASRAKTIPIKARWRKPYSLNYSR